MYKKIYDTLIFKYPFLFLIVSSLFVWYLSYNAKYVQIDASAETLLLEDDEDLKFFRESFKKYENSNFLIVTFSPNKNLLDDETLNWANKGLEEFNNDVVQKDCNGVVLNAGDTVTIIKDLEVKGAGFTAKRGTAVRNISLGSEEGQIEGRVNGVKIVILTQFVKKS